MKNNLLSKSNPLKTFFLIVTLLISNILFAQVGIETTNPKAQLDVKASNQVSPENTDGILVPRIDAFPVTNPTADQNGMLVFLTSDNKFYFWQHSTTSWIAIIDSANNVEKIDDLSDGKSDGTSIFIGVNAGLNDDGTGNSNVSIGVGSLKSNTTGSYNTANGYQSLYNNTIGNYNIANGYQSLYNNTTGGGNVANGRQTLYSNTTGTNNIAIGTNALQNSAIDKTNNIAIGTRTLFRTETSLNIAIGYEALYNNTAGSDNIAKGYRSLRKNTTGSHNTATGNRTLNSNTTGNNNTAIGDNAGYNSLGDANIFLGSNAGYNETGSNKLYIENTDADADNALIYGEFDTNILTFNGDIIINDTGSGEDSRATIINDDNYDHHSDHNIDFGSGGNDFIIASQEGEGETAGLHGDGNYNVLWSPGDGGRQLRILDEDRWSDNDGNPYNNGAEKAYIDASGQYHQVSDINKKQNIKKLSNALSKIDKINGYTFEYKINEKERKKGQKPLKASGVIAQELYKVLPEAVQISEYGEYFVHYAGITPLLIESIKELKKENEELKNRIEEIEKLEKRLEALENQLKKQ